VAHLRWKVEELAKQGHTQAEVARDLGVTRQRISQITKRYGVRFESRRKVIKEVCCPACGLVRRLSPAEARRRKTSYCRDCHIVALGNYRLGVLASHMTKNRRNVVNVQSSSSSDRLDRLNDELYEGVSFVQTLSLDSTYRPGFVCAIRAAASEATSLLMNYDALMEQLHAGLEAMGEAHAIGNQLRLCLLPTVIVPLMWELNRQDPAKPIYKCAACGHEEFPKSAMVIDFETSIRVNATLAKELAEFPVPVTAIVGQNVPPNPFAKQRSSRAELAHNNLKARGIMPAS
jgi:hypothetical protein